MISILDQIADGFTKVTKDLSTKAQALTDTTKLHAKVKDSENLLKEAYATIGKAYYNEHKEETNSEFAEQFAVIEEALETIESSKKEIQDLKGVGICANCGKEVSKEAIFCPHCGVKIERPEPEETAEESDQKESAVCSVCGSELQPDDVFCSNCGAPVQKEE